MIAADKSIHVDSPTLPPNARCSERSVMRTWTVDRGGVVQIVRGGRG